MPTYSYSCEACGHEFERFHAMTDEPIQLCPSCGRKRVRRRIGAGAGLIFKGSGFYITDYVRSKGNPQEGVPPGPSDKSAPETSQNGGGGKEKTSKGKTKSSTIDSKSNEE